VGRLLGAAVVKDPSAYPRPSPHDPSPHDPHPTSAGAVPPDPDQPAVCLSASGAAAGREILAPILPILLERESVSATAQRAAARRQRGGRSLPF